VQFVSEQLKVQLEPFTLDLQPNFTRIHGMQR